jgi:uncharacterized membrane protein YfcA
MIITGYFLAILMGITLGLIGAGGSILTLPILVYFFKILPIQATTYSLLVVGICAFSGAILYYQQKLINFKSLIIFSIPSAISAFLARIFIIPNLPEKIFLLDKQNFIMFSFAFLMLVAAFLMIKHPKIQNKNSNYPLYLLIIISAFIGLITGFVGAGGGFLIIPTLILFFQLEMKQAIATSLAIIAINSLIAFKGDLILAVNINWNLLILLTLATVLGMFFGIILSKKISGEKLKKIFATFIILISLTIFGDLIL